MSGRGRNHDTRRLVPQPSEADAGQRGGAAECNELCRAAAKRSHAADDDEEVVW